MNREIILTAEEAQEIIDLCLSIVNDGLRPAGNVLKWRLASRKIAVALREKLELVRF